MQYISKLVKIFTRCNAIKGINRINKLREESWTTSFLACHLNVLIDVLCSQCACIWSLLHVLNCFNGCTFLQRTINSDEKDFLQNLSWVSFVYEKKTTPDQLNLICETSATVKSDLSDLNCSVGHYERFLKNYQQTYHRLVRFVNKGWYVLNIVSNPAYNSIFIFCSFQVLGSIQVFMICLYFCYKLKNWISPEFGKVTCIEREFVVNIEFIELFNITVNFVISNQKGKATLLKIELLFYVTWP